VLEVGCGAGLLTVELARRGFAVTASDTSSEMLEQAKTSLAADAAGATVEVVLADVHRLPFGAGSFEMVVALGVLPWLHDPTRGVREMARVLGREQCLVLSADNLARLNAVSDPLENPLLQPLMPMYVGVKVALGLTPAQSATRHLHLPADVDRMLRGAGLAPARRTTIGYGPFTFRGRTILTPRRSLALHRRLQRAAAEHPQLRRHGWHYLVAACKGEI
jgi:ubiquinone/menaquinone biosynthesis C-methylase UbiE